VIDTEFDPYPSGEMHACSPGLLIVVIDMTYYENFVSDIARDVYRDIQTIVCADEPVIDRVLRDILSRRGKAVRPVLMALLGDLVGTPWEKLRKAAMVVEAVHLASLIHDDVVDGSHLRRGEATLNVQYSDKTSVLFGDYIFMKALNEGHELGNPEAYRVIGRAVERMIRGEIREEIIDGIIDEESYLMTIADKTASLFAASCELAVIMSGMSGPEAEWAAEFGESIGMAFQIIDDTLDFNGDAEVMGKPQFVDLKSERFTLPVIHALKDLSPSDILAMYADKNSAVRKVTALVRRNGGIDYAYQRAREYATHAREILRRFDNDDATAMFDDFFDMLMTRVY